VLGRDRHQNGAARPATPGPCENTNAIIAIGTKSVFLWSSSKIVIQKTGTANAEHKHATMEQGTRTLNCPFTAAIKSAASAQTGPKRLVKMHAEKIMFAYTRQEYR
jgi:hypothetical protein